jgi:hypothetical protein
MESTGYKQSDDAFPLMINVEAPSTLPAGYTFEAYVNDDKMRPFTCEVVRILVWLEWIPIAPDSFIHSLIHPFEPTSCFVS